eukprot:3314986-Rhodomonas_salina.1
MPIRRAICIGRPVLTTSREDTPVWIQPQTPSFRSRKGTFGAIPTRFRATPISGLLARKLPCLLRTTSQNLQSVSSKLDKRFLALVLRFVPGLPGVKPPQACAVQLGCSSKSYKIVQSYASSDTGTVTEKAGRSCGKGNGKGNR